MIFVQKIRKLIYDLLDYYYTKERKSKKEQVYYVQCTNDYFSEFECLLNEKRIGLYTSLSKNDANTCIKLLEMLYERDYKFLLNVYRLQNEVIEDIELEFSYSLDNAKFWVVSLKEYFSENKIKLEKHDIMPPALKNYKSKKNQKFYLINEIKNEFFRNEDLIKA